MGRLRFREGRPVPLIDHDRADSRRVETQADRVRGEPAEQRHVHQPGAPRRQCGDPTLDLSREQSADAISPRQPRACEHPCRLGREPVEFAVRPAVGRAVLVPDGQRHPVRIGRVAGADLVGGVEVATERVAVQQGFDVLPGTGECGRCESVERHQ
ncbi:hypothetical protein W59_31334 [Rhodococcus opacus RKJ300 = JCM 13270]|uniref:Uncharacterized protein n=1 Tax=Rhodococcus opacus RKJ300 = JCM 13270 TaxID=1165867 RepID=I0WD01_RHOOP|nr:hypothetical protein W59_31334 [Rhodococcus opacus RKJ300 = JCM 13270]